MLLLLLLLLLMVVIITILLGYTVLYVGLDVLHSWEGREIHREFWLEILEGRASYEDISVERKIILTF